MGKRVPSADQGDTPNVDLMGLMRDTRTRHAPTLTDMARQESTLGAHRTRLTLTPNYPLGTVKLMPDLPKTLTVGSAARDILLLFSLL